MNHEAVFLALSAVALAACGHTPAARETPPASEPSAVLDEGSRVPDALLRDAMEDRVGLPDMGEANVVQSWTWHPRAALSYVVWVTCRGEGDARMCALAVAPSANGFVTVRAHAAIGSAPARSISADEGSLRIFGDDANGPWTQSLNVIANDAVALGERSYAASCSR